jgi:hypothetical protein
MPEELVAKSGLQPGEILAFRRPFAGAPEFAVTVLAEGLPLPIALAGLHATAHKFSALRRQSKVLAADEGGRLAEGTLFLANHVFLMTGKMPVLRLV